jgi:hypothetical protein
MTLAETVQSIAARGTLPDAAAYTALLDRVGDLQSCESTALRPPDARGLPGGLVCLDPDIPTAILPDLHARMDLFLAALECRIAPGVNLVEALAAGQAQLLCLGDGFHAESRAIERWQLALREYRSGFRIRQAMDNEMIESLGLMEMVLHTKLQFPVAFHFLKGNHENIRNEEGGGNFSFYKFVQEGAMVLDYLRRFYGAGFLDSHACFEATLPVLARGAAFLASHAEPVRCFSVADVVEARLRPAVVEGLTWTDNGAAQPGSVAAMLDSFLPGVSSAVYFGGHRPVAGRYALRAGGRFIQIHNPQRNQLALVPVGRPFDPERDILQLQVPGIFYKIH